MDKINLTLIRKNPLTIPVLVGDKLGIFKKYNIEVNLDITEDFSFDGNQAFCSGKSDGMVGDTTFFFYMLERGKKAVITSTLTRTIKLVGGRDLPKDLPGLKVGVNRAGLFRLFLENDLKDITPNAKITWINNTYDRMQALEKGEIQALVAIEPFVTDIVNKGGQIIWDSRDSDKNMVMWAFDEDFYKNNREALVNFHKALEEAGQLFNNSSKEEKVRLCQECAKYSYEASKQLANFSFERQEKYREEDFNLCQEWMYREKEITRLYESKELIVDIFK